MPLEQIWHVSKASLFHHFLPTMYNIMELMMQCLSFVHSCQPVSPSTATITLSQTTLKRSRGTLSLRYSATSSWYVAVVTDFTYLDKSTTSFFPHYRTGMNYSCSTFNSGWRNGQSSHSMLHKSKLLRHSQMCV